MFFKVLTIMVNKIRSSLSSLNIILLFSAILVLVLASSTSVLAADLVIEKTPVSDVVISDLSQPAVFSFKITNNGAEDYFTIYSLVGVKIEPTESFFISAGEIKEILVRVYPNKDLKQDTGSLVFVYKIKGENSGIQEDTLTLNVVKLSDAFTAGSASIELQSESAVVYIKNNYNIRFSKARAKFSSVFFDFSQEFSLEPFEKKEFSIPLDRAKISSLSAGQYIMNADVEIKEIKNRFESNIKFSEKSLLETEEESYGIAIRKTVISKVNKGNLETVADIVIKKNIISRLFTTFDLEPYKVERQGASVYYYWQKELKPGEIFTVRVTTGWLLPLPIVLAAVVLAFFISMYRRSHIIIRKRVGFVRAKGGEFALRVSMHLKGRSFAERIKIFDRVPAIAKLYERFGAIQPSRFDAANRRLEWNIESLDKGEERVLSYIIYSKVGIIGRFELPKATVVYEKDGKIIESQSNRAYFISEPKHKEEF